MVVSVIFEVLEGECPEDKDADTALRDVEEAVRQDKSWTKQIDEEANPSSVLVLPLATAGYVRRPEGAVYEDSSQFTMEETLSLPTKPTTVTQTCYYYQPISVPRGGGMGEHIDGEVNYRHNATKPVVSYTVSRDVIPESHKKKPGAIFKKHFGKNLWRRSK